MWKIEHRRYRLPFLHTVRTAHGHWAEREGILIRAVRVEDGGREVGVVGWGEVAPIAWFGSETLEEAEAALKGLEGRAENLAEALARVPVACGCVRAGLAAAMETENGRKEAQKAQKVGRTEKGGDEHRQHGQDAHGTTEDGGRNMGGTPMPRRRTSDGHGQDAHATTETAHGQDAHGTTVKFLPVAGLLPAGRAALAAVDAKLELGFRVFKWKVGVGAAADEWAIMDDLLGRLPEGAKLRLDANGAWDRRTAEGWMSRAAERPVEYVEQPCFAEASQGAALGRKVDDILRGLAEDYPTPIALDESLGGAGDVARWLAADWRGVWILKPALLGEPGPVLAALAKARADVVFGSALETRVGAQSALRLAFGWAEARAAEGEKRKPRALGFGVWPLFAETRADGPQTGPFVRVEDVARMNPEALWNALS
jgi:O-succinylbenzoate synthase